jgi:hypothetical protein
MVNKFYPAIGTDLELFGNHFQIDCEFSFMVFYGTGVCLCGDAGIIEPMESQNVWEQGLIALPIE